MLTATTRLLHELRTAARTLARQGGFALPVILVLALGICATTGVVRLAGALLLQDPPVEAPDRLAWVIRSDMDDSSFSLVEGRDYGERSTAFDGLALYQSLGADLRDGEEIRRVGLELVTGNYFDVLGVAVQAGRPLLPADDLAGSGTAVVSADFARRTWGSPRAAVERTVTLNRRPFVVVGVAPDGFRGLSYDAAVDFWIPMGEAPAVATFLRPGDLENRGSRWLRSVGRLPRGVALEEAQERLDATTRWMAEAYPSSTPPTDRRLLFPVSDGHPIVRESSLPRLGLMLATALVILLVAGANTANLLLARAVARRHELAVRRALGAGRGGLVRHLFTEALLLFAAGGLLGFLAATWIGPLLAPVLPPGVDAAAFAEPDLAVGTFAAALTLATALLFGLVPALRSTHRRRLATPGGARSTAGRERHRLQAGLVIAQVALSALLLVTTALLLRTVVASYGVELGYRTEGVVRTDVNLGRLGYGPGQVEDLRNRLVERLAASPAVASASLTYPSPLAGSWMRRTMAAEGYVPAEGEDMNLQVTVTTPDLFRTLDLPLLAGRTFADPAATTAGGPREVVVNRALAERFWGDPGAALGQRLGPPPRPDLPAPVAEEDRVTVVGVVEDARFLSPQRPAQPRLFEPWRADRGDVFTLLTRVPPGVDPARGTAAATETVRGVLRSLEPDLPLYGSAPLAASLDRLLAPQRSLAWLLSLFAGLTLVVAAVGLYGILAFAVRRRLRELGVRMALGADRGLILRSVVLRGVALAAAGAGAGLLLAALLGRWLRSHLFAVEPTDPVSFAVVAAVLLLTAAVASLSPAHLATRADPARVLRQE